MMHRPNRIGKLPQELLRMLSGGRRLATQHAGEFGNPAAPVEPLDPGNGATSLGFLRDDVMGIGRRRHSRKVRDAQHLPF
jgi:hypothetical protein